MTLRYLVALENVDIQTDRQNSCFISIDCLAHGYMQQFVSRCANMSEQTIIDQWFKNTLSS